MFTDGRVHRRVHQVASSSRSARRSSGAIVGGLLAWAVVRGDPNGLLRQLVIAASGVLAQFGGVMLAFAFLATFGFNGLVTMIIKNNLGVDTWTRPGCTRLTGLVVVYTYFQIPLMLIIFLPSLDGLRQEWYDASASLGGGAWSFWRHVGGPILAPSFLGALLLLFTNAFSAYATAAGADQPGQPDHHPADRLPDCRARSSWARRTSARRWRSG